MAITINTNDTNLGAASITQYFVGPIGCVLMLMADTKALNVDSHMTVKTIFTGFES